MQNVHLIHTPFAPHLSISYQISTTEKCSQTLLCFIHVICAFLPPNVPLVLDPPSLGLGPVRRRLLLLALRVHVTGLQEARQDDQGAQVGDFHLLQHNFYCVNQHNGWPLAWSFFALKGCTANNCAHKVSIHQMKGKCFSLAAFSKTWVVNYERVLKRKKCSEIS